MATIKDIAEIAKVSPTTVSLVMNNREGRFSEKTKQKIIKIAEELNYSPNQIARSLVISKTNTLGLMIPDLTNLYLSKIATGIEKKAQQCGYSVFFCNTSESIEKCLQYIDEFIRRKVDGIIVIPPSNINENGANLAVAEALEKSGIPYVLVDRAIQFLPHDFITIDNELGGYIATQHLLSLGHRKVGCITGPLTEFGAKRRLQGYRTALAEEDIELDEGLIFEGNYHLDSGYNGAAALLEKGVTAIFACNDMMAIGVNKYVTEHGLSIPKDVSLVGFDNNPMTELLNISLTTVSQPADLMGKQACSILLAKIQGKNMDEATVGMKVRSSTVDPDDIRTDAKKKELEKSKDYFFSPTLIVRGSAAKLNG